MDALELEARESGRGRVRTQTHRSRRWRDGCWERREGSGVSLAGVSEGRVCRVHRLFLMNRNEQTSICHEVARAALQLKRKTNGFWLRGLCPCTLKSPVCHDMISNGMSNRGETGAVKEEAELPTPEKTWQNANIGRKFV